MGDDGPVTNANEPSALERLSAPLVLRLAGVPRWLFVAGLAALVLGGLFLPGVLGGLLLLLVTAFLAWLAALGWPHHDVPARLLRAAVVVLVGYVAVSKIFGFGGS